MTRRAGRARDLLLLPLALARGGPGVDILSQGTNPAVYVRPQRYAPTSENAPAAARLRGLCGEPGSGADDGDLGTFWLATPWGEVGDRIAKAQVRHMDVRALALHPCGVGASDLQAFLDRAWTEGLTVIPQLPMRLFEACYSQVGKESFDCYDIVRPAMRQWLTTAVVRDGVYHPAIQLLLLAIEPEADVKERCPECGLEEVIWAMLSTWDGLLDAEHERGVQAGTTGLAVLFQGALKGVPKGFFNPPVCYGLRAPAGCSGEHLLRTFWSRANVTAGWAQPIQSQGLIRRGVDNGVYRAHNPLGDGLADRWVNTFLANSDVGEVIEVLKEYYDYISPARMPRPDATVLLSFPSAA